MGLLLLGLAVQAVFGPTGYLEMNRLEEEIQSLIRQKEALESGNRQVMGEIESLKTDPATIEKIAREELGLVREGEIKIVTKPRPPTPRRRRVHRNRLTGPAQRPAFPTNSLTPNPPENSISERGGAVW